MEFIPFPKIARLNRDIYVTEKIDGTNASITIREDGSWNAASRTRWITTEDDQFGFAKWCARNIDELMKLGPGSHFGEWWGQGIQRGYGLDEKRFSLFNWYRWSNAFTRPACCYVTPLMYFGPFDQSKINKALESLRLFGSVASPGFMEPEGVVVFHTGANLCFKATIEKDEEPKGKRA